MHHYQKQKSTKIKEAVSIWAAVFILLGFFIAGQIIAN